MGKNERLASMDGNVVVRQDARQVIFGKLSKVSPRTWTVEDSMGDWLMFGSDEVDFTQGNLIMMK